MNRQERFRACDCTPYACCGISFFTTTVKHPAFFRICKKLKNNLHQILEKLRLFAYNVSNQIILTDARYERDPRGSFHTESILRRNVSKRRVDPYSAERHIPGASRSGRSWAIPEDTKKPSDPRKADTNKMSRR